MRTLPLLLALAACTPGEPDTGDTGEPIDPWAVGTVHDMGSTDRGVSLEVAEPGTYLVVLFSADEARGTRYGYGPGAGQDARVEAPDPLPFRPTGGIPAQRVEAGDTRTFSVYDGQGYETIEAEAVQVTGELVVWEDRTTANPLGEVPGEIMSGVLDKLEALVLPRTRQVFGHESDVDESGRVDVLVSFTVNEYGPVAYVTWCDIADLAGCSGRGNGGEIIYMAIPEPDGSYSSADAIVEIFAHELNHLVYAWHKYVLNDQPGVTENIYLTEGMSELAQDLTGFNNGNQYIWAAAIDMRDFYGDEDFSTHGLSINDILRGSSYYDQDRDGPLRGGAYLFLRWLFEQQGGMEVEADGTLVDTGGMAWLHAFFDTPSTGVDAVEETMGEDLEVLALDWYTALVVTGRGISDDPRFNYQPRVQDPITLFEYGVDPYANIHGWLQLDGPPVQPVDDADGVIRAGGVEYLEVVVVEPGTVVEVEVDAEAEARAHLVRVE